MTHSDLIAALAEALSKAQGEMGGAKKDAANPFFKSKYADLASVWDACRGPLSKNGLSVVQTPSADGAKVSVETLLMHSSGQWIKDSLTVEAKDAGAQSVGSAITYLRRYALLCFTGVAPEDDDGNEAARPVTVGMGLTGGAGGGPVTRPPSAPLVPQIPPDGSPARKDPKALARECVRLAGGSKERGAAIFTRATLGCTTTDEMPTSEVPDSWNRLQAAMEEL